MYVPCVCVRARPPFVQPAPELLSAVSTRLVEGGLIERAKPVEVSDLSFALAMLAEGEEEREAAVPLLRALAQRARADADLGAFSSRQLVTLVWAHARLSSQPPAAELSAWLESVREANERRPLMDADRNNLKRSLQLFDLSEIHVEWLIPPKEVAGASDTHPHESRLGPSHPP